jgi:hypothetical protein
VRVTGDFYLAGAGVFLCPPSGFPPAAIPNAAPEVQKEVVSATAAETPAAAIYTTVSQSVHPQDEASPEFTKELELTIHRGEDPVKDAPLLEIREDHPKGQGPSPSLAAFNKSFGTSYRGELLSVGCKVVGIRDGTYKILTLWKLPTLVDETGEGVSEQTSRLPGETARDSGKKPCSSLKRTSKSSEQVLFAKDKKGSLLFTTLFALYFSTFHLWLYFAIFQSLRIFFDRFPRPSLPYNAGIMRRKPPYPGELLTNV